MESPTNKPILPPDFNVARYMLEVICKAADVSSQQQLEDAKTTELNGKIQSDLFAGWTGNPGPLHWAASHISKYAQWLANHPDAPTSQKTYYSNKLTEWQTKFQYEQTMYQAAQNEASTHVETAQSQTGQDSKNLEQILTLAKTSSDIMAYLASIMRNG